MSLDFRRMDAAGEEVLKHTHQSHQIHQEMVTFTSNVHPMNDDVLVTHPGEVDSRWRWTSAVQRVDDMNMNLVEGGGKFPTITLVYCCTDMLGLLNPPVQQSGNSIQTLTPEKNSIDTRMWCLFMDRSLIYSVLFACVPIHLRTLACSTKRQHYCCC